MSYRGRRHWFVSTPSPGLVGPVLTLRTPSRRPGFGHEGKTADSNPEQLDRRRHPYYNMLIPSVGRVQLQQTSQASLVL